MIEKKNRRFQRVQQYSYGICTTYVFSGKSFYNHWSSENIEKELDK
jgi:hypothetical protein